jgi:CHAD domain-containing protein
VKQSLRIDSVDGGTEIRVAARRILRAKAAPLFDLEARAAGGTDEEALHDMRVASRRLRAALALFAPYYRRKTIGAWCDLVREVTRALGGVRDADVFIGVMGGLVEGADAEERAALAYLIGFRTGGRAVQLKRMRKRLLALDLGSARGRFDKAVAHHRRCDEIHRPLRELAREALTRRLDTVAELMPGALDERDGASQHALRIAFKELRYAVETLAPCFDTSVDETHKLLVRFQDALGELHDRDVFIEAVAAAQAAGDAAVAGVTPAGLDAVVAGLAAQRHAAFRRFHALAAGHPEPALRGALLGAVLPASATSDKARAGKTGAADAVSS